MTHERSIMTGARSGMASASMFDALSFMCQDGILGKAEKT
jgi:hypothetical protein